MEESTEIPALSVRIGIDESFLFRILTAFQNSFDYNCRGFENVKPYFDEEGKQQDYELTMRITQIITVQLWSVYFIELE